MSVEISTIANTEIDVVDLEQQRLLEALKTNIRNIGVVSFREYLRTYSPDYSTATQNEDGMVAPFVSRNPLDVNTALRDIGYGMDWMGWLAGEDHNGKILAPEDCEVRLSCIQSYAEFALSTRLLPKEVPFKDLDGELWQATVSSPEYYHHFVDSNGENRTVSSAPNPGMGFEQPIHIPIGRILGMLDGASELDVATYFESESELNGYKDAAAMIEDRLWDLYSVGPGFYAYIDQLRERKAQGEEIKGLDDIIARATQLALLMNELFPNQTNKWGGEVVENQQGLTEVFNSKIEKPKPVEVSNDNQVDAPERTVVGVVTDRLQNRAGKQYPQSTRRRSSRADWTKAEGSHRSQPVIPFELEQQPNGERYGIFYPKDSVKIQWVTDTYDFLQRSNANVANGDLHMHNDMINYANQALEYLDGLGADIESLSAAIKRDVTMYWDHSANGGQGAQVFGYDVFHVNPESQISTVYQQDTLRTIYNVRELVEELASHPEYSISTLEPSDNGGSIITLIKKLFPVQGKKLSQSVKVKKAA